MTVLEIRAGFVDLLVEKADEGKVYREVEGALCGLVGFRLLTILRLSDDRTKLTRVHSSDPDRFGIGGVKKLERGSWLEQLIHSSQPKISSSEEAIRQNFPDAQEIINAGCGSALNVPVRVGGRSFGCMNLLHQPNYFEAKDAEVARLWGLLLATFWAAAR